VCGWCDGVERCMNYHRSRDEVPWPLQNPRHTCSRPIRDHTYLRANHITSIQCERAFSSLPTEDRSCGQGPQTATSQHPHPSSTPSTADKSLLQKWMAPPGHNTAPPSCGAISSALPQDDVARASGIQCHSKVQDDLKTSTADVYAIGDCASWKGNIYGLIGPGSE
jgi:hypothetical protein